MNTFIHQSMVDKRQRNYVQQTIKYKLSKQAQAMIKWNLAVSATDAKPYSVLCSGSVRQAATSQCISVRTGVMCCRRPVW